LEGDFHFSNLLESYVCTGLGLIETKTIVHWVRTNANVELDAGTNTFASDLLPDLIAALRRTRKGDLVAVISGDPGVGPELEAWCRFTHNSLVDMAIEEGRTRWVLRCRQAPEQVGEDRPALACGFTPISTAISAATSRPHSPTHVLP
jgi:TusA-related sulfurtransferase